MEHWLKVIAEEERKIRNYEDDLKRKRDSGLESHINVLDVADKGLKLVIGSQESYKIQIGDILKNQSVFDVFSDAITDYNRGLFKIKKRLNPMFIDSIMHLIESKYFPVGLVVHYDGCIFNPKVRDSWTDIASMNDGGALAIYAHHSHNFELANTAINTMGGFIGDEIQIPFLKEMGSNEMGYKGDPKSQVERLACSDYKFSFSFPESIQLTTGLIDEIVDIVILPISNQVNNGAVNLIYGDKRFNATDISSMCMLNGKTVSKLNFVFKGGYVKDASYALFECLKGVSKK